MSRSLIFRIHFESGERFNAEIMLKTLIRLHQDKGR